MKYYNKLYLLFRLSWWLRWCRNHLPCRRLGFNSWVRKIPWRRAWQPTPVFLPGKFQGQRSYIQSMGPQRVKHDWATDTWTSLSPPCLITIACERYGSSNFLCVQYGFVCSKSFVIPHGFGDSLFHFCKNSCTGFHRDCSESVDHVEEHWGVAESDTTERLTNTFNFFACTL